MDSHQLKGSLDLTVCLPEANFAVFTLVNTPKEATLSQIQGVVAVALDIRVKDQTILVHRSAVLGKMTHVTSKGALVNLSEVMSGEDELTDVISVEPKHIDLVVLSPHARDEKGSSDLMH